MSTTKKKASLPEHDRLDFKVIETPDQRRSLYDPVRQEILRVLLSGYDDYKLDVRREQRTLEDGTRITEEVKVEKPICRYWLTVPEILDILRETKPKIKLATTKAYYHLGRLYDQGLIEQYPEPNASNKSRIRGRHYRVSAKFFVEVTVEASVGYSGPAVMPDEIGPRFVELANDVRQSGIASSLEYQVNLDGVLLWVSMTMSRHTDGLNIVAVVRDITTYRTLEERLQQSEVEFGKLVEESFQGYAIFQDGVPVFVNPSYASTVGRTQSELNLLSKRDTIDMVHPNDQHIFEERNSRIQRGEEILPRQRFRYLRPDGSLRWVESFGRKTVHLGRPALLVLEIDITERIEAELELRESERRNRIIVDAMSDLVLVYDSEGRYADYFAKDESLLAKPWKEMKGKRPNEIVSQELADEFDLYSKQVWETSGSITYEYEMEIRGIPKWFQAIMMLHEDKEGIVVAVKDISERKVAEESVRRSERRFREIFDSSPIAIGRCNNSGSFVELNQTFLNLFGISNIENTSDYRLPMDPHFPRWALDRIRTGEFSTFDVTYDFDLIQKRKLFETSNTGTLDLVVVLTPLDLPEDSPEAGFLIMVQDITERLRAEEALRDSEERYRAFFEQAGNSIIISDPLTSEIIDFNRQAHESLGYSDEEFRNLKLWEIDALEDQSEVEARTMEIAERGNLIFETKWKTKLGEIMDVRVSSRIVTFRDRMINQAIVTEITEEKKGEENLRASEEKYKSLFESSVDAIVLVKDGKFIDVNPAAVKIFGIEREELIDKTVWSVSPRRQPDGSLSKKSALEKIEKALSGEPQLFYWKHKRLDGAEFDAFVGISAVRYQDEELIQAVIRLEISEHFQLLE